MDEFDTAGVRELDEALVEEDETGFERTCLRVKPVPMSPERIDKES